MKNDVILYLPWPPTVNSYYGTTARGIKYVTKGGRVFREHVEKEIHEQGVSLNIDFRIYCEIVLFPPDRRTRDLDNYMKALLDACSIAKLWEDDKLIDQLVIYRGAVTKQGSVRMRLAEAGPIIPLNQMDF